MICIPSQKTLTGFWDTTLEPLRLGSICIFANNIQCYAKANGYSITKLALVGNGFSTFDSINSEVLSILFDCLDIDVLYTYESAEQFFEGHKGQELFPRPSIWNAANLTGNLYNTMQLTQYLYKVHGKRPDLSFNKPSNYQKRKNTISLHLKNASKGDTESNANFLVWQQFIESCASSDVHFLLIGDDPVPRSIKNLPHVTSLSDENISLTAQLVCIQESSAFMGMASGPCNVAVLSQVPYLIFKHPSHHAEIMKKELGNANRYGFSVKNQYILRRYETFKLLSGFFNKVYKV